ncbi:MAG: dihydrodipicolinate synthase family protein [Actinomycetota bacterium]|nr:dihydrodipicolinate synthase family protein [Actinomycetota bacterium]
MTATSDSTDRLSGVYVASVTPFRDDTTYSVDLDAYLGHVRWLEAAGVHGVVAFGTNGEGPSVSVREKTETVRALVDAVGLPVIATVAEANLPDALEHLAALDGLRLAGVMVLPPYYFKPAEAEGLRAFYERVLAATSHPVVVYHIPKYAVPVPPDVVTSLPVWGVKDSGGEAGYAETVRAAGRGVLLGTEDDLPGRLPVANGSISALANIAPELVVRLHDAILAGDEERAGGLAQHLQTLRARTKEYASPGVLKRVAEIRHGHPMGTVRPPLVAVPADFDAEAVARVAVPDAVPA